MANAATVGKTLSNFEQLDYMTLFYPFCSNISSTVQIILCSQM
jgi:hypothetical protein